MNKSSIILIISLLASIGCKKIYQPLETSEGVVRVPIARVNDFYLYKDDINGIVPKDLTSEDSTTMISKYIDSWIRKQLTIERASQEMNFDQANIERKVLDYRYALMVHEYEKFYINQRLNKEISEAEIDGYYNKKFENFVLRQNIVRCLFAIFPLEAPQIKDFRNKIKDYPKADIEEIQSYCYRFASKSYLESEQWLNFDEVIANTPMANVTDKVNYLKSNSFVEATDEESYYFIRILDYKISNQISPLEYIKDDIESILINKKKIELRKELEDKIYQSALNNNEFEIY